GLPSLEFRGTGRPAWLSASAAMPRLCRRSRPCKRCVALVRRGNVSGSRTPLRDVTPLSAFFHPGGNRTLTSDFPLCAILPQIGDKQLSAKIQSSRFAVFAQVYAVSVSEFVRKVFATVSARARRRGFGNVYFSVTGYFASSTSFSKRGSPRKESQIGSTLKSAGVIGVM